MVRVLFCLWFGAACGCSVPYAAEKLARQPGDNPPTKGVLTASDQNEIGEAFDDAADGRDADQSLKPSGTIRWSDVPLAVVYACDEAEMAVVEADEGDAVCRYRLISVEDWPGTLIVTRVDDGRIYEASATVGEFGNREDRANRLLEALESQLKAFAKKRKFD
jgi:hypothetical protein